MLLSPGLACSFESARGDSPGVAKRSCWWPNGKQKLGKQNGKQFFIGMAGYPLDTLPVFENDLFTCERVGRAWDGRQL